MPKRLVHAESSGGSEIRTHRTACAVSGFQDRPVRPLRHPAVSLSKRILRLRPAARRKDVRSELCTFRVFWRPCSTTRRVKRPSWRGSTAKCSDCEPSAARVSPSVSATDCCSSSIGSARRSSPSRRRMERGDRFTPASWRARRTTRAGSSASSSTPSRSSTRSSGATASSRSTSVTRPRTCSRSPRRPLAPLDVRR